MKQCKTKIEKGFTKQGEEPQTQNTFIPTWKHYRSDLTVHLGIEVF